MYEGPIIDAFLHAPWIGGPGAGSRADEVPWSDDRRLRRVVGVVETGLFLDLATRVIVADADGVRPLERR